MLENVAITGFLKVLTKFRYSIDIQQADEYILETPDSRGLTRRNSHDRSDTLGF